MRQEAKWLFVSTFDTKVTDNLCSGWVFFLQTNFDFLTSHFWRNFLISFKSLYAIIDLLINLSLSTYYDDRGDNFWLFFPFPPTSHIHEFYGLTSGFTFYFSFYFITFNFFCYYCSIKLKRQSEHSGLCPDTSRAVLFIFRIKRTISPSPNWFRGEKIWTFQ